MILITGTPKMVLIILGNPHLGLRDEGLGCLWMKGLGYNRDEGLGFRDEGLGFGDECFRFRDEGFGC